MDHSTADWFTAPVHFYTTGSYPCAYLPEQQARSMVAVPSQEFGSPEYSALVHQGFRRSGTYTYRPRCDHCQQCVSVRIPVDAFTPNRSQRRCWQKLAHLHAEEVTTEFRQEHYELYLRYQQARHHGGEMAKDDRQQYEEFMLQSLVDSRLVEFRDPQQDNVLRMVSVIDVLADGLSSMYTFYDPDYAAAGLGTFGILWQIDICRRLGLPHLYLGYWIAQSRKMAYKAHFQPLEAFWQGRWLPLTRERMTLIAESSAPQWRSLAPRS